MAELDEAKAELRAYSTMASQTMLDYDKWLEVNAQGLLLWRSLLPKYGHNVGHTLMYSHVVTYLNFTKTLPLAHKFETKMREMFPNESGDE